MFWQMMQDVLGQNAGMCEVLVVALVLVAVFVVHPHMHGKRED